MGIELKDKGIAAISLYPGSVATEFIVANSNEQVETLATLKRRSVWAEQSLH